MGYNHIRFLRGFNRPNISWDTLHATDYQGNMLCKLTDKYDLEQLNTVPSRLLDLVFTNKGECYSDIESVDSYINTDHQQLKFNINIEIGICSKPKVTRYSFKDVNFEEVDFYLSVQDLESIILENSNCVDTAWFEWWACVLQTLDKLIPCVKIHNKSNHQLWIDGEVINLIGV